MRHKSIQLIPVFLIVSIFLSGCGLFYDFDRKSFDDRQSVDKEGISASGDYSTVRQVIDGDTIILENGERVRLIGINTPEEGKYFYDEAKEVMELLALGKQVRLEKDIGDLDKYGRLLRYIYTEDHFINLEMVKRGFANSYTYPTDGVFEESTYDADSFTVRYDTEDLILTFSFVAPIENPWGSPIDLSLQTMDVYIDKDPAAGTGARMMLPGRNAALVGGSGWEFAVWAEGWTSQVVQVDPETLAPKNYTEASNAMNIVLDPAQNAVVIRVPLEFLGEGNPDDWAYAAVVLGQEGYPAEGVWRVRDIANTSSQWLFGGAPLDANHTRIIDLILPEESQFDQVMILSEYLSSQSGIDNLSPDDFAQIPMLISGSE